MKAEDRRPRRPRPGKLIDEASDAERARALTIMLVDARPWSREALASALERTSRDLKVLRFGGTDELAAVNLPAGERVIVLVSTGGALTGRQINAWIQAVQLVSREIPLAALADMASRETIVDAIERGLRGFLPVSLAPRLVTDVLHFIAAGGTFVPVAMFLDQPDDGIERPSRAKGLPPASSSEFELALLTPRERAVLDLLHQGRSNKQIARELAMHEATAKVHVRHIMRKLGVTNRTQVAIAADALRRKEDDVN